MGIDPYHRVHLVFRGDLAELKLESGPLRGSGNPISTRKIAGFFKDMETHAQHAKLGRAHRPHTKGLLTYRQISAVYRR